MSSILTELGFIHLESLQEFSARYPFISPCFDKDLENIWICHKHFQDIPKLEEFHLQNKNYDELFHKVKMKIDSNQHFVSSQINFKIYSLFDKIYHHFKNYLATYIFNDCYIFYNWGFNSFEPIFDHGKLHKRMENRKKRKNNGNVLFKDVYNNSSRNNCSCYPKRFKREGSPDLFDEPIECLPLRKGTYRAFKAATKKNVPFVDLQRNSNDPNHRSFNLNKILYDMKQKPKWPANHILSGKDVDKLLLFITQLHIGSSISTENKLTNEQKNWIKLKTLLRIFIEKHEAVEKNNGFGRIMKRHLKKVTTTPGVKLAPIPKSTVLSYILDILRRVIPLELFGTNRLRKKFFSSIVRIISGAKNEDFIWHSLLQFFLENKSDMQWCSDMSDSYTQTIMISKVFKFIVIHYVFVILKNNFYITETGSSGFSLRFYRKGQMESILCTSSDKLLRDKHIKHLKKPDFDLFTIEEKWVNTGVIDDKDLKGNTKITLDGKSEFKQAIASIRFLPKNDWSDDVRIITKVMHKRSCSQTTPESVKLEKVFKNRLACRRKKLFLVKLLLDFLVERVKFGIKPVPSNPELREAWNKVINLKNKFGKLYFVRADIADAFGSVKYSLLVRIIKEILAEEFTGESARLIKITELKKTGGKIEKVSRLSFSHRPKENSVLFSRSFCVSENEKINDLNFIHIIQQIAMQQKVEMGGEVFKLIKGLAQGSVGKFSPQLCEIYYSWMDRFYFQGLINLHNYVFLRGVDDYLLVTPCRKKAEQFLKIVRLGIRQYNVKFNNHKLKSNLLEDVDEVSYLGLIFNFSDMSVMPNYSKFLRKDLLSTMKLSDSQGKIHFSKVRFLETRSLNINSLKLQPILLDKNHNSLKNIRQVVFQACLMQCLRVMTLARYLFPGHSKNDLAVSQILFKSCNKIKNLVSKAMALSKQEVHWLFHFAALYIFQKFPGQFKQLLAIIRFKLEKSERTFITDGSELFLELLKNDLHDKFGKEVYEMFDKLASNSKPFDSKTLKQTGLEYR